MISNNMTIIINIICNTRFIYLGIITCVHININMDVGRKKKQLVKFIAFCVYTVDPSLL